MDYERNTPPVFRGLVLLAGLPAADLSEAVAAATAYELFFALARDIVVTQGLSLILDSPAQFAGVVRRARAIAEEGGVPLKVIACRAEFETRQRRLAERPRLLSHLAADPTPDRAVAGRFAHLPPG